MTHKHIPVDKIMPREAFRERAVSVYALLLYSKRHTVVSMNFIPVFEPEVMLSESKVIQNEFCDVL
jgi:hypothetical protein